MGRRTSCKAVTGGVRSRCRVADDVDAVPALIQVDAVGHDPWPAVQRWVAERDSRRSHRTGSPARASGRRARRDARRTAAHLPFRRGHDGAQPVRAAGRRSVRDVGGPALRAVVGAGGRDRRQGGKRIASRRHTRGSTGFFDWMNSGKLSYMVDFDSRAGCAGVARRGRRRDRVITPGGLDPPRPRADGRPTRATAESGCGSPATAPTVSTPTGWRSATTPRFPGDWSAAAMTPRSSAVTRSPTPDWPGGRGGGRAVVAQGRRRTDRVVDVRRRRYVRRIAATPTKRIAMRLRGCRRQGVGAGCRQRRRRTADHREAVLASC